MGAIFLKINKDLYINQEDISTIENIIYEKEAMVEIYLQNGKKYRVAGQAGTILKGVQSVDITTTAVTP